MSPLKLTGMVQENKHMKKTILLLLVIYIMAFLCSCSSNKNVISKSEKITKRYTYVNKINDTIVTLPVLTVKDLAIYPILDSIIDFNSSCIYTVMGERIWFGIASEKLENDTLIFYLNAFQYCDNNACKINESYFGIFHYRDFLFAVSNYNGLLNDFFEQTDSKEKVITSYSNTIYYLIQECKDCYSYDQKVLMYYYYADNQFQLFHKASNCTEYFPIYHKIRKGDSLGKIATKYGITQSQIIRLNNLKEPILPNKGKVKIQ